MTPEQLECFWSAFDTLIDKAGQLTSTEFRSGVLLLAVAMQDNGYANFSHQEAGIICGTDKNATMRAHLIHLRSTGVLSDYSTNGTVRIQFTGYSGKRMIVHRRGDQLLAEPTNSLSEPTKSRAQPTVVSQEANNCALSQLLRALRSRDRALSQHFSRNFDDYPQQSVSMLVSELDPPIPSEIETNKLTATVTDPVEEALSVALMTAAGMWMKTAKQLAKQHPFELIRRAIAFWWCNRKSRGGEFAETPGIVLTWLNNLEQTTIPPMSREFLCSDLYLRHRTKAELDEDEIEAANQMTGEAERQMEEILDVDQPWPEMNEFYAVALERLREQLPSATFNAWLEGSRAEFDDQALTCTVIVDSTTKRDWLAARLRQLITREVRKSTGYNLSVSFEARRRE